MAQRDQAVSSAALQVLRTIATRLGAASTRELTGALGLAPGEACELLIELEEEALVEPVLWRVTTEGRALLRGEA